MEHGMDVDFVRKKASFLFIAHWIELKYTKTNVCVAHLMTANEVTYI